MEQSLSTKPNHKVELALRFILSFVLGALSASFFLGSKSRDISELLIWKGEVKTTLERMDKDGTNRSHWVFDDQAKQITSAFARITELEHVLGQRSEQMNVMQFKIEKLEVDVKEIKTGNRR